MVELVVFRGCVRFLGGIGVFRGCVWLGFSSAWLGFSSVLGFADFLIFCGSFVADRG